VTTPHEHHGRVRRLCSACWVEIEITRPQRPIGKDSARAARHAYATEIRRQILWEATCPDCRGWWNSVINIAQHGPEGLSDKDAPGNVHTLHPRHTPRPAG
jgi:hypothetical protein